MSKNAFYDYLKKYLRLEETDFSKLDNNKLYKVGLILIHSHTSSLKQNFYNIIPAIYYDIENDTNNIPKQNELINTDEFIYNQIYYISENVLSWLYEINFCDWINRDCNDRIEFVFKSQPVSYYTDRYLGCKNLLRIDSAFDNYFLFKTKVEQLVADSNGNYTKLEMKDKSIPYKFIFIPINEIYIKDAEFNKTDIIDGEFKISTDKIFKEKECTDEYNFTKFCEERKIKFVFSYDLENKETNLDQKFKLDFNYYLNNICCPITTNRYLNNNFIDKDGLINNKYVLLDVEKSSDCFVIDSLPKITKEEIKDIKIDIRNDDNKFPHFRCFCIRDKIGNVIKIPYSIELAEFIDQSFKQGYMDLYASILGLSPDQINRIDSDFYGFVKLDPAKNPFLKMNKNTINCAITKSKNEKQLPYSFEYLVVEQDEQVLNNIINNKKENNKMKNNTIGKLVDEITISEINYIPSEGKNEITWKDGVTTTSETCVKTTYAAYVHRVIDTIFTIKDVKFSADKVIVFWNDDTKTIVTIGEDEKTYDVEKALFAAYTKKVLSTINGNAKDRSLNRMIDKWSKVYEDSKKQIKADITKIKKRKDKKLGKDVEEKKIDDKEKKVTKKTKKVTTKTEKFYVSGVNE